jgi:L-amino acid N-acyltransferase YncA
MAGTLSPNGAGCHVNHHSQETKEEQLKRLQDDQLRKIGGRIKHKSINPPTTSLQDLELARSPFPGHLASTSNAEGSNPPSDASTADGDSTKAIHHGKLFRNNSPAEASTSLAGWDGKWQPPPVDWNDRPRFNNNSLEYRNGFNHWLSGNISFNEIPEDTVLNLDLHPDGLDFVRFKEGINVRNASRKYGFTSDIVDIVRHVPPLEDYEYLNDWGKLDLSYGDNARFQWETTESLVTNWVAQKTRRNPCHMTPQQANHIGNITPIPTIVSTNPETKTSAPKVNIYLRPATRTDTEQLTELYNWYVLNSPRTTDIEPIQGWDMRGRLDDCWSAKLPFIVAVSREHKSLRRLKGSERIVGFASATDFSQSNLTERISAELEVYVHPDWLHKGIGRSLTDKLLDSTDRGHLRTSTVTFTCDPDVRHLYSAGGGRDLNVLIFIIRHFKNPKPGTGEDINTLKQWLIREFDFEESGCIKGGAAKFKRLMNMTYMTKETKWQPEDGNIADPLNTS